MTGVYSALLPLQHFLHGVK